MKVFATLATALGVSSAAPTMQQQHNNMAGYHNMGNNMNNQMVSSMNNNRWDHQRVFWNKTFLAKMYPFGLIFGLNFKAEKGMFEFEMRWKFHTTTT